MSAHSVTTMSAVSLALCSGIAAAGSVVTSVAGIEDAIWTWDIPMIMPGETWTESFSMVGEGGITFVSGTAEAGVSQNGRGAWLTVTNLELGTTQGRELEFVFDADIDFGTVFSGWANPTQEFHAVQAINSANARIDWAKGSAWNGIVLFPLAGFYEPGDLRSSLSAESSRFEYFLSPVNLQSETRIFLRSGGFGDSVLLPDSAHDFIEIPGPRTLAVFAGLIALRRRR